MPMPAPTLHTGRLLLRAFDETDADDLFDLHANALVMRYWDGPVWTARGRAERFIANCREMEPGDGTGRWNREMEVEGTGARPAVDRVSDGTFIGWCALQRWNPEYRSASLG
jgi:RimJ/RimL family protein N-acetyltransferase